MDVESYRQKKALVRWEPERMRLRCVRCLQPDFSCFCELIKPFDPGIRFVILIHPIEIARRIATGRMAHLILQDSLLISGHNFSQNKAVNQVLEDSKGQCALLYPGAGARNLTLMSRSECDELFPKDKKLTLFVVDGTWHTAKKMIPFQSCWDFLKSENLKNPIS